MPSKFKVDPNWNTPLILPRSLIPKETIFDQFQTLDQKEIGIQTSANFDWSIFRNKPFWIENPVEHEEEYKRTATNCCFNHIVGLPEKRHLGEEWYTAYPLFDFQIKLQKELDHYKKVAILKARGMGITEFFLRHMSWKCLKDNTYNGQDMCIIAGPRMDLATDLIRRLKLLFLTSASMSSGLRIVFTEEHSNQKMLMLNGVRIRAFPSHNPNAIRLLKDPAYIFVDEADFFHQQQHFNVKNAAEGAVTKSNPWIIFVSTPYKPRGFMQHMMEYEPSEYHRIKLDYRFGLPRPENMYGNKMIGIYSQKEIDQAMKDEAFEQEYNLKFMGAIGTIFSLLHIKEAQKMQYDPDMINHYGVKVMGIDPGFGPSPVGICVLQLGGNAQIQVIHADDYPRLASSEMISLLWEKIQLYNPNKIIIDGNNPEWVKDLKLQIGEEPNYLDVISRMKKDGFDYRRVMKVVPINFNQDNRAMLGHAKMLLETGKIAIHPKFDKLITALGSATDDTGEGKVDKDEMAYSDVFDAFRLALFYFKSGREKRE